MGTWCPAARVLRNEFFELAIDPHTGAIRSIFDFHSRAPRLAQQVALRFPGSSGDEEAYSIMAADEIRVLAAGPVQGEVLVRGRLLDRSGELVAGFQQSTRVTWGSRVIEVEIEFDPQRQPEADPWKSYYAARFAWGHDAATLYRGVNQATVATRRSSGIALLRRNSRRAGHRTTVLAAGLPYHRRRGLRKLDTLLLVPGETARRFRLGIAIDAPQPMAAALDFAAPSPTMRTSSGKRQRSGSKTSAPGPVALPSRFQGGNLHALVAGHPRWLPGRLPRAALGDPGPPRHTRVEVVPRGSVCEKGRRR